MQHLRKVESVVKSISSPPINMDYYASMSPDEIRSHIFTLVNFEYAVATKAKYHPCEMGVIQFSMSRGLIDAYHIFVSPMPLPQGFSAEAKTHSDETHQIPIFGGFPYWNDDFGGTVSVISEMVGQPGCIFGVGNTRTTQAALGAGQSSFAETSGCFAYMMEKAANIPTDLKLFPAEELAKTLIRKLGIGKPHEASKILNRYLEREKHNFDRGTRCFYHEGLDCVRCALATVYRFYFDLMDMLYESRSMKPDVRLMSVPENLISRDPMGRAAAMSSLTAPSGGKMIQSPSSGTGHASVVLQGGTKTDAEAEVVPLAENSNETSQSKRLPDVQKNQDIRSRLKRISTPLGEGTIVRISRSSLVGEHATGEAAVNPTGTADGSGGMDHIDETVGNGGISNERIGRQKAKYEMRMETMESTATNAKMMETASGGADESFSSVRSDTYAICGNDSVVSSIMSQDSYMCTLAGVDFDEAASSDMSGMSRAATVIRRDEARGSIKQDAALDPFAGIPSPSRVRPPDPSKLPMPPLEWLSADFQREFATTRRDETLIRGNRTCFGGGPAWSGNQW